MLDVVEAIAAVLAALFTLTGPLLRDLYQWLAKRHRRRATPKCGFRPSGVDSWVILIAAFTLTALGLVANTGRSDPYSQSPVVHVAFAFIGVALAMAIAHTPIRTVRVASAFGLLLAYLLFIVSIVVGSRMSLSASLPVANAVIVLLVLWTGSTLSRRSDELGLRLTRELSVAWLLVGSAVLITFVGLGFSLLLVGISLAMLIAARTGWKSVVVIAQLIGIWAVLVGTVAYRVARYTDVGPKIPEYAAARDLLDGARWFGSGLTATRELTLGIHDNVVLALMGYRLGLVGMALVVLLLVLMVAVMVRVGLRSKDVFSRVVAIGLAAWVLIEAVYHSAFVLGVVPLLFTQMGFPFVARGGWQVLFHLIAAGIVASLANEQRTTAKAN